jgi:Ca2+-binding RTX toxin-like protein
VGDGAKACRGARGVLAVAAATWAVAAIVPSGASAAITCAYDQAADTLTVTAGANGDIALVGPVPSGQIGVSDLVANLAVDCTGAGAPPTVNNTTNINFTDAGNVSAAWSLFEPEALVNGGNEIDLLVALGNGFDEFNMFDASLGGTSDFWTLGAAGINWNGDLDADISFLTAVDTITLNGAVGNDAITAQGAQGTGAAFGGPAQLGIAGGEGEDVLEGGTTNDSLVGDVGNDTLRGFAGNDNLDGGPGTNQLDGGSGNADAADYSQVTGPVTADLAAGTAQKAGQGDDILTGIETIMGSPGADTLRGDGSANILLGADGDDTLIGRGGTDSLYGGVNSSVVGADGNDILDPGPGFDSVRGEEGIDTVTYAGAAAGVTVNLTAGTASGDGDGEDGIAEVENLIGSPFADTLTGDAQANSITGLGGNDTISALGGADSVDVRDGGPDTASCGTEVDTAIADQASVDSVNADCENVSFLPEADDGGGGGADTELDFELAGKRKQRVLKQKGVFVKALCPLEDCAVTVEGTAKIPKPKRPRLASVGLTSVSEAVVAGDPQKIKLRLKRKQLRKLAAALRAGARPKVKVRATAADAAGNEATDSLVVRAKR